jgi:hypothetical protein
MVDEADSLSLEKVFFMCCDRRKEAFGRSGDG